MTPHKLISLLGIALVLFLVGCASGDSCQKWDTPIPISQAAADRLQAKIDKEISSKRSGPFRLEITQEEATSYLAFNLRNYPIGKPEIRFSQGLVYLSGEVVLMGPAKVKFATSFLPQLSGGLVAFQVREACVLGISAPQFLRDRLSRTANDSIAEAKPYVTIRQLEILEGRAIIAGDIVLQS